MQRIDLRVDDDTVKKVANISKKSGVSMAEAWRGVIEKGLNSSLVTPNSNDLMFTLAIQNLTLSQRIADHLKDDLIDLAKNDARQILKGYEEKK